MNSAYDVAVILPCLNEEAIIAKVIKAFQTAIPGAVIFVYDNGSDDDTAGRAREAGAIVRYEPLRGKGFALMRAFADIDADIYVVADGDGTYAAEAAPNMIQQLIEQRVDMVTGIRRDESNGDEYRQGHRWGNRFLTSAANKLYGGQCTDVLSGYRVMTRRFVKTFTWQPKGFEIEIMLTLHALEMHIPQAEYETTYSARAQGTESKLKTYQDGVRILAYILLLLKDVHPLRFFAVIAFVLMASAVGLMIPIGIEYLETGLVPRFPTVILATGLAVISAMAFVTGLLFDSISRRAKEQKRLAYLSQPAKWLSGRVR
jgi:glycosyltransferase involved in cell wall biosynthesis